MTARKPYAKAGNKINREGDPQKSLPFDRCQTPALAICLAALKAVEEG